MVERSEPLMLGVTMTSDDVLDGDLSSILLYELKNRPDMVDYIDVERDGEVYRLSGDVVRSRFEATGKIDLSPPDA